LVVRYRDPPRPAERDVFRFINDGPEQSWLRFPQQLGTPWALVATAAAMAVRGRRADAAICLLTLPAEKGVEVLTKKFVQRPRPLYVVPTALRDDAPLEGPSMPSGHAAIATASTLILVAGAPRGVAALVAGITTVTAYTRVHQGAHWPSDTVAGCALGAAVVLVLRAGLGQLAQQ
jgi:undecaprenyl-diphosphatase